MNKIGEPLPGVLLLETPVHRDTRGYFIEIFQNSKLAAVGVTAPFVQDNVTRSRRRTIRGLHFQNPSPQGKLISVIQGRIFDVMVDVRRDSPRFKAWAGVELNDGAGQLLWIPPGFAHGFQVLSEDALVFYKATDYWNVAAERAIRWDDPAIGIHWPLADPILSEKDAVAPRLEDVQSLPES